MMQMRPSNMLLHCHRRCVYLPTDVLRMTRPRLICSTDQSGWTVNNHSSANLHLNIPYGFVIFFTVLVKKYCSLYGFKCVWSLIKLLPDVFAYRNDLILCNRALHLLQDVDSLNNTNMWRQHWSNSHTNHRRFCAYIQRWVCRFQCLRCVSFRLRGKHLSRLMQKTNYLAFLIYTSIGLSYIIHFSDD